MLPHRNWATISSSFSRHSGLWVEPALTKKLGVTPHPKIHEATQDEPSKLRRSFLEVPSFSSCLFSSIILAASS